MIGLALEFDAGDGPITEEDREAVHEERHPICATDGCEALLCLCPMVCEPVDAVEVAPGVYVCSEVCAQTYREIAAHEGRTP